MKLLIISMLIYVINATNQTNTTNTTNIMDTMNLPVIIGSTIGSVFGCVILIGLCILIYILCNIKPKEAIYVEPQVIVVNEIQKPKYNIRNFEASGYANIVRLNKN